MARDLVGYGSAGAEGEEAPMIPKDKVILLLESLARIRDICWGQPYHTNGACCGAAKDADEAIIEFLRSEMVDAIGSGR